MTAIREEVFSRDTESTSPSRISFSFNLSQLVDENRNGIPPQQLHQRYPESSSPGNNTDDDDFEFGVLSCCRSSCESSADQLFENGKILPGQMMMIMKNGLSNNIQEETCCGVEDDDDDVQHQQHNYLQPLPFLSPLYSSPVNNNGKKISDMEAENHEKFQSKSTSSSFWGFMKSSDNNHDNNSKDNISFLFPVPVLPRNWNCTMKQKQSVSPKMVKSSSVSSAFPQRSAALLRKSRSIGGSYYGGSIKVSPVLHFTAPSCISKATMPASFLGCFFSNNGNKDRKNKT